MTSTGGKSFTSMVIGCVSEPPVLDAVTVYVVVGVIVVGVPSMSPVDVRESPAGSEGDTVKPVAGHRLNHSACWQ